MSMLSRLATLGAGVRPLPSFVSSSFGSVSGTLLAVTAPTSIQDGNLIVALTFATSTTVAITPPAGFSQIQKEVANTPGVTVNTKIAASESGNYTFTSSATTTFSVVMLVYQNATNVNTVGTVGRAASANTATASTITPTYRGVLLAAFSNSSVGTITTPPSGMTSRVASDVGPPFAAVYELSPQEVAATGNKTLVWTTSAGVSGRLLQVTNEPDVAPVFVNSSTVSLQDGTTLPLTVPSGVQQGDLMIAFMTGNNTGISTTTWTSPSGWTEVADRGGGSDPSPSVSWKIAGASEPASYTFTSASAAYLAGSIAVYRGGAFDRVGTFSSNAILNSISPTLSQSLLLAYGLTATQNITIGTPLSMTGRIVNNTATLNSYKISEQEVAIGATGDRTMTSATTGILLSIKPTRSLT